MDNYKYGDKIIVTEKGFYEGVKGILVGEIGENKYSVKTELRNDILWFHKDSFKKREE